MGCCASSDRKDYQNNNKTEHRQRSIQFGWNLEQLQAKQFVVDGANIKLISKKRQPYLISSKQPFPLNGKFQVKIRYVSQTANSFSLGLFHFGTRPQTQIIQKVQGNNSVRLFVNKKQGELKSEGNVVFSSKDWKVLQEDTVIMGVDLNSKTIEWKKENNRDVLTQKTSLPSHFQQKNIYLLLIMYESQTQLNIQVSSDGKNDA